MPLTVLDVLDISHSLLVKSPKFPPSITILIANGLIITPAAQFSENYDFTVLEKLYEIYLDNSSFTLLPALNLKAPITKICMHGSHLKYLDYGYLAHFCQLKYLGLDKFLNAEHCCYVRLWVDEYGITSELKCGKSQGIIYSYYELEFQRIKIFHFSFADKECPKDKYPFNATAIETHQECLKQVEVAQETLYDSYGVILNIAVGAFLICVIAFIVYKFYGSSDVREYSKAPIVFHFLQPFVEIDQCLNYQRTVQFIKSIQKNSKIHLNRRKKNQKQVSQSQHRKLKMKHR